MQRQDPTEPTTAATGETTSLAREGRAPFTDPNDVDELIAAVERYERGELSSDEFRAFRLIRGVYGQRQDDVQMIRAKIPGGVLLPEQLEAVADVAEATPRGLAHVTTRQNFQLHFVKLADVAGHLRRLEQAGLTSRGACGNAVRNVTGCARAGLCAGEAFDTTPFIDAITLHFLRRPLAEGLPRKFKIALSGCATDCALGAINDLGLIAHRDSQGARRFTVFAAGGLATLPTSGLLLHDSYPAERINEVAEALVRLFDRTGNRANRSKARLKFVVKTLGEERFRREYEAELERVITSGEVRPIDVPDAPAGTRRELVELARRNVTPTRNVGRVFVELPLPTGDITAAQLRGLAGLARRFGEGSVRATVSQNLMLRDVAEADLPELFDALTRLGLAAPIAGTSADVTSCPGADTCKLAITNSKDLGRVLGAELSTRPTPGVSINISGCPNSCGQHHLATIGLHGGVRKIDGRAAPQYLLMVGGHLGPEGAKFGKVVGKVPARRVTQAIDRLIALAERSKAPGEETRAWLERADREVLRAELADLTELGADAEPGDFVDYGADGPFRVIELEGECAA